MKKLLVLLTTVAFFASCSSDDGMSSGNNEIRFTSGVSLQKSSYNANQVAEGQKVGVFITEDATTPAVSYEQNLSYTADGDGNLSGPIQYFPSTGNGIKISAYHPYSGGSANSYLFTVQSDQSTLANVYQSDLLYCPQFSQAPTSSQIELNFDHKLALVTYTLAAGTGNPDLTDARISIVNASTAIEFDRISGQLGAVSQKQEILMSSAGAVVVPQEIAANTKLIKIVLKSGKELFYTQAQALTLEGGHIYTFNLKVNLSEATGMGTTVEEWKPGKVIAGDMEEEVEKLLPIEIEDYYMGGTGHNKYIFTYDNENKVTALQLLVYDTTKPENPESYLTKISYDAQGRIVKEEETISIIGIPAYQPKELKFEYAYTVANQIEITKTEYEYSPARVTSSIIYVNDQTTRLTKEIIKVLENEEIVEKEYACSYDENGNYQYGKNEKYDTKKNPLTYSNLPKWYLHHNYGEKGFTGLNNLIEYDNKIYETEYNISGYPTKISYKDNISGGGERTTYITFKYK